MSVNFSGWTGSSYDGSFLNQGTKDYAKSKGVDDITAPVSADDLQALENHWGDITQKGVDGANSNNLQDALFQNKFKDDPKAQRAAILVLCNPNLLNKLDGWDHNSIFNKEDFDRVIKDKHKTGDVYNAVKKFADNTNVLEYFEYGLNGGGAPAHGNDRFGTAAIYELQMASKDDPLWSSNDTLSGINPNDRQGYIDAAKTIWNNQQTVGELAGDDGIMNHGNFTNWVSNHKPVETD